MQVALQEESYTSRTCPHCLYVRSSVKGRMFCCPNCHWTYHRDGVGAINIRQKYLGQVPVVGAMAPPTGLQFHAHTRVAPGDGKGTFLPSPREAAPF
jgi:putative transposase